MQFQNRAKQLRLAVPVSLKDSVDGGLRSVESRRKSGLGFFSDLPDLDEQFGRAAEFHMSLSALRSPPFYTQMDTLQYTNECDFDVDYSPMHSRRMDTTHERGFGDRLNDLMQERFGPRSQSALARESGVPQATISRTLKKASAPEMETVVQFAKVFGVACEWLLTERGPKYVRDMRNSGMVNPGANVTDPQTDAEKFTLISRLENLHTELSELLHFVKGIPSISANPEHSDDMNISPARARVAAAAEDVRRDRSEGEKHGKHGKEPGGRKTR